MTLLSASACGQKKTLVAYFSATGTTGEAAAMIAKATGGELYQIVPESEYSAEDLDWRDKTSRCCIENDNPGSRPPFLKTKKDLSGYDVVFLGYPNWWNMAPRIINSFIEAYGLKGVKVIPFMTSGGSTIDNSVRILKRDYPDVNWQEGRSMNGMDQAATDKWIKGLK